MVKHPLPKLNAEKSQAKMLLRSSQQDITRTISHFKQPYALIQQLKITKLKLTNNNSTLKLPKVTKCNIDTILRQYHPDFKISQKSVDIIDAYINQIYHKILNEATRMVKVTKRKTLNERIINLACQEVLSMPLEVSKSSVGF